MKIFFKISFVLIFLLFITLIGFAIIFNPNDYKDDISKLVKEQTGRELLIKGDISLSLFPWIGLDLGAIEMSNAKGFGKRPFAKMERLQIRAKLWPLFQQRLEADTVVLEGLQLNLVKNKQGVTNWDDLVQSKPTPRKNSKTTQKTSQPIAKKNHSNILAAFALNGIEIKYAQLNFNDQQQNKNIQVKKINLSIGKLEAHAKTPVSLSFHLQEKSFNANINLETNILFSPDFNNISFYNTNLTSDLLITDSKQRFSPQIKSTLMQLNIAQQTFKTNNIEFRLNTLKLHTKISAISLFSKPRFNGSINVSEFNPRTIMNDFNLSPPNMSDKHALTSIKASLDVKGILESIVLSNIIIMLDQTEITGQAKIKAAPNNSSLDLTINNINVDRYLPAPSQNKVTGNKTAAIPEAALIPIALLGAFNLEAQLKINKLQIKNTHWKKVQLNSHSQNGHIQISPLTLQGYGSTIKGNVEIKVAKNNARLSGSFKVKDIMAGKLFNDLSGKDKLKGKTSIVVSFNTSGTKLSQLKQNLNGKLKLKLKNGTLKGFALEHQQRVLSAKLKGKTPPATPKPEETKIANLTATAIIHNGVLSNKDLRASTPFSRFIGKGTVDIAKEKMNYVVSVKFTSSTKIKVNTPYEKMNDIPLDIIISGTFDDPKIKLDFKKVVNKIIDNELKKQKKKLKKDFNERLEEEKKKLGKDLEKKLKDELKKLFKF